MPKAQGKLGGRCGRTEDDLYEYLNVYVHIDEQKTMYNPCRTYTASIDKPRRLDDMHLRLRQ